MRGGRTAPGWQGGPLEGEVAPLRKDGEDLCPNLSIHLGFTEEGEEGEETVGGPIAEGHGDSRM